SIPLGRFDASRDDGRTMSNTPPSHQVHRKLYFLILGLHVVVVVMLGAGTARAQGLGSGTLQGIVKDPTGGVMQAVEVKISNPISWFTRTVTTDASGRYVFGNLAPNPYHVSIEAEGFQKLERDVDVRTGVPVNLDLTLALAAATSAVDVVGHAEVLLERDP